jgi:hypothetical protein
MKNLITLFLVGTLSLTAQPKHKTQKVGINVSGVELTYNKVKKRMTLVIKPEVIQTNDPDMYTLVKISKNAELQIIINGEVISSTESYFKLEGHILESSWAFTTLKPAYCDDSFSPVTRISKCTFYHINPGEEYILSVSNLCNGKYQTNYKSASLITQ